MSVSKKDLQLLVAFAGVLLVALTYFFVFVKVQDYTELLKTDNTTLQTEVTKLEELNAKKDEYVADTKNYDNEYAVLLAKYDISYMPEDEIMFIADMESTELNQVSVTYLNLSDPVAMEAATATAATTTATATATTATDATATTDTTAVAADGDLGMTPVENSIAMFQVPTEFGFNVTYEGFKNMVRYLYSTGGRKNIDSINLLFDSATGQLSGSITANRYFLTGTDQIASTTDIPAMETGVEDIFKTTDGSNVNP